MLSCIRNFCCRNRAQQMALTNVSTKDVSFRIINTNIKDYQRNHGDPFNHLKKLLGNSYKVGILFKSLDFYSQPTKEEIVKQFQDYDVVVWTKKNENGHFLFHASLKSFPEDLIRKVKIDSFLWEIGEKWSKSKTA